MKPAVPILLVMIAMIAMIATGVSAQTFETEPVWSEPETFYGYFGSTLAAAGDVDGNGWDDVIVGGPFHTDCCPSFQQYGAVFLYSGSTVGLLPSIAWFEVGPELGTTLGEDTARAGDVNGDGFADVVFNSGSGFGNGTHQVHVRFGSSGGLASGWNFDSGMLYGALGPAVDGAGDVNGDGFDDIVSGFSHSDNQRGRLRAFYGSPTGLPLVADWEVGGAIGQELGNGIEIVGDVDGDGYDDVLVCDSGTSFLLYAGSASGLGATPVWTYPQQDYGCWTGQGMSAAGDLNDDGFADIVVGARGLGENGDQTGLLVFPGSSDGLAAGPLQELAGGGEFASSIASAGDVNGDGFSDLLVGAPGDPGGGRAYLFLGSAVGLQPEPAWASAPVEGALALGSSVSPAGDVNGDGLADLLVGDPNAPTYAFGRALLFLGVQAVSAGPAGAFDSNAAVLRLGKSDSDRIVMNWSASCSAEAEDYSVYRGALGDFQSHSPVTCSTGQMTAWEVSATDGDGYYLVVPRTLDSEGSYGTNSFSAERQPMSDACLPQSITQCGSL